MIIEIQQPQTNTFELRKRTTEGGQIDRPPPNRNKFNSIHYEDDIPDQC